ncbi:MAG: hypothetical protein ACXQTB_01375 [Candidatus Nezhaarchaeales archaeon]
MNRLMRKGKHKAVSTIIATLILIGVVAAMGSFIYWYAVTYAKSTSKISAIAITEAKISKTTTGNVNVLVTLRNQGTTTVDLLNVTVYDDTNSPMDLLKLEGTMLSPKRTTLNPGDSVTVVYVGNKLSFTVGDSYTIVVITSQGAQQTVAECTLG